MMLNDLRREAHRRYESSSVRQKIAEDAINLGEEWIKENISAGYFGDRKYKRYCRRELYAYIKAGIDVEHAKQKYNSIILIMILGAILSWVIKRILDKLFPA